MNLVVTGKAVFMLLIFCILLLFGSIFSYQLGLRDSSTYVLFNSAGISTAYQKLLLEKGEKKLLSFLESNINSDISIYRSTLENQSFLSGFLGPLKDIKNHKEHYQNYYNLFKTRRQIEKNSEENKKTKIDIEWLSSNIDKL